VSQVKWQEVLGWGEEEFENLRFVGYSYLKQGAYEIAITFFEALVILTDAAYDLQTLGALHLQKGNGLSALNYIERALRREPNHYPTLLNRAKALFGLGYKRQGLMQARLLEKVADKEIASQAAALILAHTPTPIP